MYSALVIIWFWHITAAADALSRTLVPQDEQDKENQDEYLVYPDINEVHKITETETII